MTRRVPPGDRPEDAGFARVEAVAGLAREVDGLRRGLEVMAAIPERVDELARLVGQLADTVAATPARPGPTPAPSWLTAPTDPDQTAGVLGELCGWLHVVYLRYSDTALPECWLWHPDVIEELLWLMHAWVGAYQGKAASVTAAGDWHDRQRPGVARRIRAVAGSCSREKHQTRDGWADTPTGAVPVPGVDALDEIAAWWATGRDQPAPEPPATADQGP